MDIKREHGNSRLIGINRYQAGRTLMIELRKKRIEKLNKQLSRAMYRVMDLEAVDEEDTEPYIRALLKAKECSCLIQLHDEAIKNFR